MCIIINTPLHSCDLSVEHMGKGGAYILEHYLVCEYGILKKNKKKQKHLHSFSHENIQQVP